MKTGNHSYRIIEVGSTNRRLSGSFIGYVVFPLRGHIYESGHSKAVVR